MKVNELISALNAATDTIAARIQALKDAVGSFSPEQEAELNAIVADLNALGADPANPVPEPVPVEPPVAADFA